MVILHIITDTICGDFYVCGSWDNWQARIPLQYLNYRCLSVCYSQLELPDGTYQYKFVDNYMFGDIWYCAKGQTIVTPEGYINNVIQIKDGKILSESTSYMCNCNNVAIVQEDNTNYTCLECLISDYKEDKETPRFIN